MSAVLVSVLMDMVASSLVMNNKGGNPGYYDSGFFFSFLIFPFEAGRGRRTPSASGGGSRRQGASSRRRQALHKPPPRFPPPFVRLHNVTPSAICLWLSGADDSLYVRRPVSKVQLYLCSFISKAIVLS